MSEVNVLEEIDLDKWIYAGYMTTYREGYTWPGEETLEELGTGEPEVRKYIPVKPDIYKEEVQLPCSYWCACLKKSKAASQDVDDRLEQVDKDYLKGVKSAYQEDYCSGTPVIQQPYCTVIPKIEEVEIPRLKLTAQEERKMITDYLLRQRIKILRKRPPALEVT